MDNPAFCGHNLDPIEKNDPVKTKQPEEATPPVFYPHCLRSTLAQCFATFIDSLSLISIGLLLTAPSIIIADVHNAEVGLTLNNEQVSWYASLLPIFQPFGCLLGGFLQNYIGRRQGLLLMYVTALITWIVLNKAASVELLYMSSILAGITIGFTEAPGLTYVSEITTPKLRGILVMYNNYNVGVGVMLMFLLASFTDWRSACLVCVGLTIFSTMLLIFIPDSPVWLINKGKTKEAIKALQYLRGWVTEEDVLPEFEELSRFINKSYADDDKGSEQQRTFGLKDLLAGHTLRPLIFVLCTWFFAFHSALQPAKSYSLVVFNNLHLPLSSNLLGFLHGLAVPIGGIAWAASVRTFGKRKLALSSIMSSSIISLLLGLTIAYRYELNQPWIFIVLYIFSGLSYACILSTPWILMVEIYPPKTKSIATGITAAILYITISIYTKMFYFIEPLMTVQGTFLLYGLIGISGFMYLWVFMPETEGKTMAEIAELFADDARQTCPHFRKKK